MGSLGHRGSGVADGGLVIQNGAPNKPSRPSGGSVAQPVPAASHFLAPRPAYGQPMPPFQEGEQRQGEEKRHHEIDKTKQDQRGSDIRPVGDAEPGHHRRLEHADAAGVLAAMPARKPME